MRYLLILLISLPALAQDRWELTASAVRSEIRRDSASPLRYDSNTGWGASLGYRWTSHLTSELSTAWTKSEVTETGFRYGQTKMMPVTAALQWHAAPWTPLDVYIGGGAAWVRFSDLKSNADLETLDINRVKFKSRTGVLGQAGLTVGSWRGLGVNIDAKYLDVKTRSQALFDDGEIGTERGLKIKPWLWSAGLRWSF